MLTKVVPITLKIEFRRWPGGYMVRLRRLRRGSSTPYVKVRDQAARYRLPEELVQRLTDFLALDENSNISDFEMFPTTESLAKAIVEADDKKEWKIRGNPKGFGLRFVAGWTTTMRVPAGKGLVAKVAGVERALQERHYGRNRDCFPLWADTGKDADLEREGCWGIRSILNATKDSITFEVSGHATFGTFEEGPSDCGCDEVLQEIICGGFPVLTGDWSGDDWSVGAREEVTVSWVYEHGERLSDEKMAERVINVATATLEDYFTELDRMHDSFDEQYKYHEANCEKEESC